MCTKNTKLFQFIKFVVFQAGIRTVDASQIKSDLHSLRLASVYMTVNTLFYCQLSCKRRLNGVNANRTLDVLVCALH